MPIVNFWAFYRIRKLRKHVLYVIVPVIILNIIHMFAPSSFYSPAITSKSSVDNWGFVRVAPDPIVSTAFQVAGFGLQGLAIYLVIIWSRQHNRRVDASKGQAPPNT